MKYQNNAIPSERHSPSSNPWTPPRLACRSKVDLIFKGQRFHQADLSSIAQNFTWRTCEPRAHRQRDLLSSVLASEPTLKATCVASFSLKWSQQKGFFLARTPVSGSLIDSFRFQRLHLPSFRACFNSPWRVTLGLHQVNEANKVWTPGFLLFNDADDNVDAKR